MSKWWRQIMIARARRGVIVPLRKKKPQIIALNKIVRKIDDLIYIKYLIRFNENFLWTLNRWLWFKRTDLVKLRQSWWRKYKENSIEHFKKWLKTLLGRLIRVRDDWWATFYRVYQRYYSISKILYKDYFRYVNIFINLQMPKYLEILTWNLRIFIRGFLNFYKYQIIQNSRWPWFSSQKLKIEEKIFGKKTPLDYIKEWKLLEKEKKKPIRNIWLYEKLNQWRNGKIIVKKTKCIENRIVRRKKKVWQKHNKPHVKVYAKFPYRDF